MGRGIDRHVCERRSLHRGEFGEPLAKQTLGREFLRPAQSCSGRQHESHQRCIARVLGSGRGDTRRDTDAVFRPLRLCPATVGEVWQSRPQHPDRTRCRRSGLLGNEELSLHGRQEPAVPGRVLQYREPSELTIAQHHDAADFQPGGTVVADRGCVDRNHHQLAPSPVWAEALILMADRGTISAGAHARAVERERVARHFAPRVWKALPTLAIPAALWFVPLHLEPRAQHAIAISLFMILAWATELMDHGITGLVGCYLFWALGVARFDLAFSGFADDTPWFLMGAILFGTMASKSGLARRLAFLVTIRVGTSYSRLLLALILSDFLLTFLVPSGMARVTIMAAVAVGLIDSFGLGIGSNVGRGMFLILTYTAGVFDKSIIAGAAAITGRGIIENIGHVQVLWSRWLLAYLPSDIVTILVAWRLTLWLYPPENPSLPGGIHYLKEELRKMGRWTTIEKKALALMLVAIGLWATDFLHHISSSMIGLGIGLLAVLPFLRILNVEDVRKLNFLQLFFVAAAVGMGKVLTATKGLDVLTNVVFAWMQPILSHNIASIFVLYWTGFLYHIFLASEISMLGTSMPLLMQFASTHGLSALKLGMIWVFSSGGKIFVYQSGVLIIGYAYGYFRAKDILRLGLLMSVVDSLLLLLVVPLYWPMIGAG
ncbi:MAG: hypothetical protein C5B51_18565 [Terriglobia bacterium]|nr:MAG: hypothetical protein C5B51_18565 [Terriglobia bacterium]